MTTTTGITFKKLSQTAAELSSLSNNGDDKYYSLQEVFKGQLLEFIRTDFSNLKTNQLLQLCGWVQTHRPIALHTFLIYCERLA